MNFLCDVHLSFRLVKYLSQRGHDVVHVNHLPEKWFTSDVQICDYADKNNFILITKDADFRNSFMLKKTPHKVIRITLGNISHLDLINLFENHLEIVAKYLENQFCYIEINKHDVLVIMPE